MEKKLSLDDLEELINKIPSENPDNDIHYLNDYLSIAGQSHFQFAFEKFQKINLKSCDQNFLEEVISSFIYNARTSNQSVELFTYLNGKTDQALLVKRFTRSEFIADAILPILTSKEFNDGNNFRSLCNNLINAISIFDDVPDYLRSLRQSIFQLAFARKDLHLCLNILKSVNLARSTGDFFEFSSYSTSLIQLVVDDESIARSLFEYMLNCSTFYYNEPGIAYETWFITCLTSFAPLLYGKTVHIAALDYVKYFLSLTENNDQNIGISINSNFRKKRMNLNVKNLKQIISKFEDASRPIYNNELPLNAAPSLLRPYHLFKLWNVNILSIDLNSNNNIQPEQIYNALLNLYKKCPGPESSTANSIQYSQQLFQLLSQLPIEASLPFYFLLAQRGYEKEFHNVINDAFENKNGNKKIIEKILLIFEKAARTAPRLLRPHFNSISKLKIEQCAMICPLLIKSDFISFTSLWKFVKNLKFSIIKPIIREGIVQIQRRSRSFENAKFIINVLRQFFGKPSSASKNPAINWSAVAEAFPDDYNISSSILLNESIVNEEKTNKPDNNSYLLSWKEQFMRYVSKSPSTIHRIIAVPYLLLSSLDNNIPFEKLKWAISKLPAYKNISESILEGYALFEISKHIISQSVSSEQFVKDLHNLFDYEEEKVTTYASSFAHAAMTLKFGNVENLNALKGSIESNNLLVARSSKLAIKFLQLSNFIFDEKYNDVLKKVDNPIVDVIFGLLSPTLKLNTTYETFDLTKLQKDEKTFIDMIKKAHSMDIDSIIKIVQVKQFNNFNELREHFIFLSVSCFLLLPARSVSQSSTEKCISLLNSPSSTNKQKNFALLALSQTNSFPDNLPLNQLANDPYLHKSLLMLASRTKNAELISSILSKSNDFTIVEVIKPLLPFLDQKMISNFVEKTALDTDVQILFDTLDLFTNPNIIFIVFTDIRVRPIIDTIRTNRYQKLRSAISKLGPQEQMEKITFTPYDDFALLSMFVLDYPITRICRGLISEKSRVTLPGVFLVLLNKREEMFNYADSMFAFIQNLEADEIVKALKFIATFYLIGSSKEPFDTIRIHLEANPSDLTDDLAHSLIPSLFSRFINKVEHYEILLKANKETKCLYLDEAVQALKLKPLS